MNLTRRQFVVTAAATTAALAARAEGSPASAIHLLALGDWGAYPGSDHDAVYLRKMQKRVAAEMAAYLAEKGLTASAVLALGDNFYHELKGTDDERWKWGFEDLFPVATFACPFYAVLGNHDYEDGAENKPKLNWKHEIEYATLPGQKRWQLPSSNGITWYREDFSSGGQKLLTVLFLDSNIDHMHVHVQDGWKQQTQWLLAELAKNDHGRWVMVVAHHPMFTDGFHHDGAKDPDLYKAIRADWLPHLGPAVFYLSGHDHNLQHIQHPDWKNLDFLISGAGGGEYPQKRESTTSPWTTHFYQKFGFVHLVFTPAEAAAYYLSVGNDSGHTTEHEVHRPA